MFRNFNPIYFLLVILVASLSGCGGGGGAPTSGQQQSTGPTLTMFVGNTSTAGSADGLGTAASFNNAKGIAIGGAGNIYVADFGNNTIRQISPSGAVTTLAGTTGVVGSANGAGVSASFNGPWGIATDSAGNIYVADMSNHVIRKISTAGIVSTFAGTPGAWGAVDGTGASARFNTPLGVATDGVGNVYVADTGNDLIRVISSAGVVSTIAGSVQTPGSANGTGSGARFNQPTGITVDIFGNIYVADSGNSTIRKISGGVVTTIAGAAGLAGNVDGAGVSASFAFPNALTTDSLGNIYVADTGNRSIRKVSPIGVVTTLVANSWNIGSEGVTLSGSTLYLTTAYGVAKY